MVIDGRLGNNWIVICACGEHSFMVRRLGLAVECPRCGRLEPGPNMAAEYYLAQRKPGAAAGDASG